MRALLAATAASAFIAAAATVPAWADTDQVKTGAAPPTQEGQPTTTGKSQTGVPGLQGSKSGPSPSVTVGQGAVARVPGGMDETNAPQGPNPVTKQQDSSGIAGKPGSKSGPSVESPSKQR